MSSLAATNNVENWISRTHSPSVASGSSNEGWLQNNAANGNLATNAAPLSDPWLSKPKTEQPDPWLSKAPETNDTWQQPAGSKPGVVDPWAPAAGNMGVCINYPSTS